MNIIDKTKTLCPECLKILDGTIFERDKKVFIEKECPEHGKFEEIYWGDYEMFMRAKKFAHDGKGIENPNVPVTKECPGNCGLCKMHKSHTALGNIVVSNRCDLACFYCFFYAKAMGYVYEPTQEQIRMMLRKMREEKPVPCNAVQLTGGEPTIRDDIIEIIRIAKEEGYDHVQLNTNGIRISQDLEFAKKVRAAGVNNLYLSYDGTTAETNPKNHPEIQKILENCRKSGIGIVLVPTVIRGINDHDVGNIINFAIENNDIVRGVNFQPVSLVGRITKADRNKMRITIPDVIKEIQSQTKDQIKTTDWYSIPTVTALTHFIEALTQKSKYELSTHFACGMATYVFIEDGKIIPITDFIDVEGLMKYLEEKAHEIKGGKSKVLTSMKVLANVGKFIDKEKQPKGLDFKKILIDIAKSKGDYSSLRQLHHKSLFLGMMHFQDLYNYDIERTKRCCIHYAQPDGTIVPFCAFNVIPEWYRDKIQEQFSESIPDWEKRTGKKLSDDLHKREEKE